MIYTGNVILTKNPKVIESFFLKESSLGDIKSMEEDNTFIFSNGLGSNLIEFSDSRDVGNSGKFIITLEFLDPNREFELRSFKQEVQSSLSKDVNDFAGERYILTYGVGSDPVHWASPYILTLAEIDFNATEGRVFKLTFIQGDELNSYRSLQNKDLIGWGRDDLTVIKSKTYKSIVRTETNPTNAMQQMLADAFVKKEKVVSNYKNVIFLPNTIREESIPDPLTYDSIRNAELGVGPTFSEARAKVSVNYDKIEMLKKQGVQFTNAADPKSYTRGVFFDTYIENAYILPKHGLVAKEKIEDLFTFNLTTPLTKYGDTNEKRSQTYRVYRLLGDSEVEIIAFEETQQDLLSAWADAFKDAPEYGPIQKLALDPSGNVLPTLVVGDKDLIARYLYIKIGAPTRITLFNGAERFLGDSYRNNPLVRSALLVNGLELPDRLKLTFGEPNSLVTKMDITTKESYLTILENVKESIRNSKYLKEKIHEELFGNSPATSPWAGLVPTEILDLWTQKTETNINNTLVTSDYITKENVVPILLDRFKNLYKTATVQTVPLFQYSGYKLLEQHLSLTFKETPIFGSIPSELNSSFYSGTYKILGYNHTISSRDISSTFNIVSVLDEEDITDIESILADTEVVDFSEHKITEATSKLVIEDFDFKTALPILWPDSEGTSLGPGEQFPTNPNNF
tara:strand:+ start:1758 stop:3806 length:2049 start_codon:yes stop_codon:yes gene_type:complete